jgi:hypothetical protein
MATGDLVTQNVDPLLHSVGAVVASNLTTPGVFTEIGLGVAYLVPIIIVHGWCLGTISTAFSRRWKTVTTHTSPWRVRFLVSMTITLLALTHFFETLLWTLPIWKMAAIPNLRDAYYFVLEAYTTLGEGVVALPHSWRLAGPIIAISGLFTFSWTGSVLVYVMTETSRWHSRDVDPSPPDRNADHAKTGHRKADQDATSQPKTAQPKTPQPKTDQTETDDDWSG